MEQYIAYNLALGITRISSKRKQEIGRTFAKILGFHPGPPGPDGGIDGASYDEDDRLIYFQSKLSGSELNIDHAKILYADLMYHSPVVCVMLAGKGYKKTFSKRLFHQPHIEEIKIHLLTLFDVLAKTDAFYAAVQDVPKLRSFEKIDWKQFR